MDNAGVKADTNARTLPKVLALGGLVLPMFLVVYGALFAWRVVDSSLAFWSLLVASNACVASVILTGARSVSDRIVLTQITLLLASVRTTLMLGVPFVYAVDPFRELQLSERVITAGWSLGGADYESFQVAYISPLLYFLAAEANAVSGLSLLWMAKWFALIFTVPSILFVYLIGRSVTDSGRAGLISALAFVNLHMFMLFHSLFVRESLSFVFFLGTIACIILARKKASSRLVVAAVLFGIAAVLSHHLTPLLLGLFLVVAAGVDIAVRWVGKAAHRHDAQPERPERHTVSVQFGTIVLLATFGYWAYLKYTPLEILVIAFADAARFDPASFDAPGGTRTVLLLVGESALAAAFGLLSLVAVLRGPYRRSRWGMSFVIWGAVAGVVSIALVQRLITWGQLGSTFMAARFQTFGYPFLFILSFGYLLLRPEQRIRRPSGKAVAFGLLILLVVVSAYRIPPYLYSSTEPNWTAGEERLYISESEYAALMFDYDSSANVAADPFFASFFYPLRNKFSGVYAYNRTLNLPGGFFSIGVDADAATNLLFARPKWLLSVPGESIERYLALENRRSRIYDNGEVELLG